MLTRRTLTSIVAVTALAVPGLAIAQSVDDPPTDPETTVEEAADDEGTDLDSEEKGPEEPEPEEPEPDEQQPDVQQRRAEVPEDDDGEEDADLTQDVAEDEGHGDVISALATCLPSGAELHGTGLTKGSIVSQVASTGGYVAADGDEPTPVTTPEEAEDLCTQVQEQVSAAEETGDAPDRAKGRPDWAGPKDDDGDEGEDGDEDLAPSSDDTEADQSRGGPPDHAGARGRS